MALPYARQITARVARVPRTDQGETLVKLEIPRPGGTPEYAITQAGETVEGLYVAYAGPNLVILCDTLHWKVLTWQP